MKKSRVTFIHNGTIQVFNLNRSQNRKITNSSIMLIQTYAYSFEQFEYAKIHGKKGDNNAFNSLDKANCMDCPFSLNTGNGGCYTHGYLDSKGKLSQMQSIANEFGTIDNIPSYNEEIKNKIVKNATGVFVRFGSYGEPSLHPIELVKEVAEVSKQWTGYTHQWFRKPEFRNYFMASVHNEKQARTAAKKGFRSFVVVNKLEEADKFVNCPASKEMGRKSNCSDCGLCSGVEGKGQKSVAIVMH